MRAEKRLVALIPAFVIMAAAFALAAIFFSGADVAVSTPFVDNGVSLAVAIPASLTPGTIGSAALAPAASTVSTLDFVEQVAATVRTLGGLTGLFKISAILTLLVSSLKVSFMNKAVWSKLGAGQVFVAPGLALLAGLMGLGAAGAPVTGPLVVAYLTAGGGAVFLHELLDAAKGIPGIGAGYLKAIAVVEGFTGGGTVDPPPVDTTKAA